MQGCVFGLVSLGLCLIASHCQAGQSLPSSVTQLAISIAPSWSSVTGRMQLFERNGKSWKAVSPAWRVLYGKNGLAWGRGLLGVGEPGPQKVERDRRAPAGVFKIGKIYTYDSALPAGADYPFHTIAGADAWIDDPNLPSYNQHVVIDPKNPPSWFEKQKMRLDDPPHRWLVEIRHNADPPVPGAGSAIFFHIQRGANRPSAGCTVMSRDSIVSLIQWLRAGKNPHYVLLTRDEYFKHWKPWGLPTPDQAVSVLAN
jgi:L,D-peptidoglycan transpeptidase YkuD (ErfK/YbiS/YcfS/YnhG family)